MTTPNDIDVHVGQRVRRGRSERQMSQSDLADALGITFQQIQKYEKGTNRISASKLYMIAGVLKVDVGWFFHGLDAHDTDPIGPSTQAEVRALSSLRSMDAKTRSVVEGMINGLAG